MRLAPMIAALVALMLAGLPAQAADGPFAPRVIVNDKPITNFQVEQRVLFLRALNSAGDLEKTAVDGLIEDQLRFEAAKRDKVELTDEAIATAQSEFAGRANLSTEEFLKALAESGVQPQTFRDFVRSGLAWREVIRARFVPRASVSEGDIDRALASTFQRGDVRVLLSELIIPAPQGQEADALAQAEELRATIASEADFAAAAGQFSAAPSAAQGGKIDWLPLGNLPPTIRQLVLVLKPGEVTPPVPIPNAVALFQLRGLQETGAPATQALSVDYMQVLLPEADTETAARLRAGVDRCDDIFGLTKGLPASQVIRQTQKMGEVPRDIALELARLDAGETSFTLRRGGARVFLMLCARNTVPDGEPPTRGAIRDQLINQRLAALADGYLRELRAAAVIRQP